MPDERMIHRRMLRGERIGALTDFERGVWLAYELVADDYGVMRVCPSELQKAIWLERKPSKTVLRGFAQVVAVGLVRTWLDGRRTYAYQPDWQKWQTVRHPRATIEPCPPIDELRTCDPKTQGLFRIHPRCPIAFVLQGSGSSPEIFPGSETLAGAGGRETLTLTQTAPAPADGNRIQRFRDRYSELHREWLSGVDYIGNPQTDYAECLLFVSKFADWELDLLMIYWFNSRDPFASGTRSIAKFRSRISGIQEELQAKGLWTADSVTTKVS